MKNMKRNANLMIKIDPNQKQKLQDYCDKNDLPMSIVIRQLIKEFLNKEDNHLTN